MRIRPCFFLAAAWAAVPAFSQLFTPVDTNFTTASHVVPPAPVKTAILFRGKVDSVANKDGRRTLAKDGNDFTGYVPIDGRSDSGYVIVNNEANVRDSILGDGGGMTVFTAYRRGDDWQVADDPRGRFRAVDFSMVGGTMTNCGGMQTPWGTVLTAEEAELRSNAIIHDNGRGFTDTSNYLIDQFNGGPVSKPVKRYQNLGWMVEVDVAKAKALKKHYNMGRFEHEGGICLSDRRTCYLTDDITPAVFFKFVSDAPGSYHKGKLYAYKQTEDGRGGSWLELPMELDSLIESREMALKRGATTFTRNEWAVEVNGKIYLSETGRDLSTEHARARAEWGSTIAKHLRERTNPDDSSIVDYFGRILRFDPATDRMEVFLEGGPGTANPAQHFSNPDGLTAVRLDGKDYLVIQEDLTGRTQGRVSAAASAARTICEMYWLDLSIASPKVDDLRRMVIGPSDAEITGARFTPDGKTLFVNMQHPDKNNPAPYNTSYTAAIWGFHQADTLEDPRRPPGGEAVEVRINALSRFAYFSRKVDVEVFGGTGKRLERHRNAAAIDIQHFKAGTYFLRFPGKQIHKLVLR